MEKLAVVVEDDKTKTASTEGGKCPKCGAALPSDGESFLGWCPNCGTAPFEPQPE